MTRLNSEPAGGDGLLELQQFLVDEIISMENLMLNARFAGDTFYENCYKHKKQALMIVDNKIDELINTRPTRQAWEWLPIETAPRDGKPFFIVDALNNGEPFLVYWQAGNGDFRGVEDWDWIEMECHTHWCRVEFPPQPKAGDV